MSPLDENQTTQILPWENFSNWVHAICVVTFDLELGQAMELIYPSHRELSEKERANICYLAFPDSNSGLMGNVQFHFRIRLCPDMNSPDHASTSSSLVIQKYNDLCPVALKSEVGYMYGYVYFRQVKDKSLKRGYFQKSVVLLSRLPLVAFFNKVMGLIAPEYFETGEASLEAACHDIDQWPAPIPGQPLSLPLHGTLIKIRIASHQDKLGLSLAGGGGGGEVDGATAPGEVPAATPALFVPSPHEMPAFAVLAPVLPYLNLLWELVLVAEPIVVMATNPTTASRTVQTLVSLISPMRYNGDYRPFFTIHDSEFKEYTTRTSAPPNIILGVTNPFFAKTLQHWPHVIRLGEDDGVQKAKLSKIRSLKVVEHKPGVYTKFKPHLQADKGLVKRLLKGVQMGRPLEVQSALLRRHLLELTQSFIIPLERYAAQLMPFQKNVCPFKSTPDLRPFNPEEFLATLEASGPQLTSGVKGDWEGLYRRFFKSANFTAWFETRFREMSRKLSALHMQAMSEANMKEWVTGRCEVEVVDMFLRLRSKLEAASDLDMPKSTVDKLNVQVDSLLSTLPEDLRSVLQRT